MRQIEILPLAKFSIASAIFTIHDSVIPEDLLLSRRNANVVFWPTAMMPR